MAEENKMSEENKKTIISFIAGLLIGGLLVFIFIEPATDVMPADDNNDREEETEMSNDDEEREEDNNDEEDTATSTDEEDDVRTPVTTGDGAIEVDDQSAGGTVAFESVEFPSNTGWIGIRDYANGQMTGLLGVARYDTGTGLLPSSVRLLRPTVKGNTYAVVFYSDNGDRQFSLATDAQLAGVMETFKAE